MRYDVYSDVKAFYNDTYDIMMRHEEQNLIPLGNIIIGNAGKDTSGWRDTKNWYMAAVSGDSGICLTAIMTPPFNLTLYETDNREDDHALARLVDGIISAAVPVTGVMSASSLAMRFAKIYAEKAGMSQTVRENLRLYELTSVNPDIPCAGTIRPARDSDMAFLPYWLEGFNSDCFGSSPAVQPDADAYSNNITSGRLFILGDDGVPVSMAKISREMQTICGIGGVYTPPYLRGKGYASSCVAAVSSLVLERGYTKCVLYTDLANPTSNSIYQKIGYRPIGDFLDIRFS